MWLRLKQIGTRLCPALALGLFSGRVLSEQWSAASDRSLDVTAAIVLTLVTVILSAWLIGRRCLGAYTWPALLLFLYVFYPEPDPKVSLIAAAVALVTMGQVVDRLWTSGRVGGDRRRVIKGSLLLAAAFFVLYVATLAPDVLPADNGEFQIVANNLGVAHPPGFPLYTLLGHLMTRLPLAASPAYKVNLLSAVTSALTLELVYLSVYRLGKNQLAAATAAIALGTSTTFWAQATTANIRSLTALFTALAIYALICFCVVRDYPMFHRGLESGDWKVGIGDLRAAGRWLAFASPEYYLILFALAMGLGLGHHLSLGFMGLVFGLFVLVVDPALAKRPRRWLRPVLAGLLGLLPLVYLPLRAGANVRGAQPGLATMEGFVNHVLALGFQGDFFHFIEPVVLWQRLRVMADVMTFQFSPWLLLGMGAGLALLLWRERHLALLLGGSFAFHTFVTATYRAPQTVEYMLPAYVPAVICLGYGVSKLTKWPGSRAAAAGWVLAAVVLVAALGQGFRHYPSYLYLHQSTVARDYVQPLLAQAPAGAVILADWHWTTPLWYLQEVEGQRPDVRVQFVAPGGEPYVQTWARLIAEQLASDRDVIATHFDEFAYAALPTPEPLGEAFLFRRQPRTTLPEGFVSLGLVLDDRVEILGYQLEPAVEIGQETVLTLGWQPISNPSFEDSGPSLRTSPQSPISLFAHLIGPDGSLYAQDDPHPRPQPEGITLTQFRLTPRPGTAPGEFEIVVGVVRSDGVARAAISKLIVTPMSRPPVTQNPTYRTVADERPLRRLIGYDWDNTLPGQQRLYLHWRTEEGYQTAVRDNEATDLITLPAWLGPWGVVSEQWTVDSGSFEDSGRIVDSRQRRSHYVPLGQGIVWTGETISNLQSPVSSNSLSLPQHFISSRPVTRDLVVAVSLIGYQADGVNWAWLDQDDSVPAMGAIPTLKWVEGSRVRSPHFLTVNPAAPSGQALAATLRLYDAFTNRPLPILDERIMAEFPWVPLGQSVTDNPSE